MQHQKKITWYQSMTRPPEMDTASSFLSKKKIKTMEQRKTIEMSQNQSRQCVRATGIYVRRALLRRLRLRLL